MEKETSGFIFCVYGKGDQFLFVQCKVQGNSWKWSYFDQMCVCRKIKLIILPRGQSTWRERTHDLSVIPLVTHQCPADHWRLWVTSASSLSSDHTSSSWRRPWCSRVWATDAWAASPLRAWTRVPNTRRGGSESWSLGTIWLAKPVLSGCALIFGSISLTSLILDILRNIDFVETHVF